MFHVAHFLTGVILALILTISTCSLLDSRLNAFFQAMLFLISIVLVIIVAESLSFLSSSSAALPACLDGFIVETNGSTGEAHTCTLLHP